MAALAPFVLETRVMALDIYDNERHNRDGQLVTGDIEADTSFGDVIISTRILEKHKRKRQAALHPLYAPPTDAMWNVLPHELVFVDSDELYAISLKEMLGNDPYLPVFTCANGLEETSSICFVGVAKGQGMLNGKEEVKFSTQIDGNITIFHTGTNGIRAGQLVYAKMPDTIQRGNMDIGKVAVLGVPQGKVYFQTEPLIMSNVWAHFNAISVKFRQELRKPGPLYYNALLAALTDFCKGNTMMRAHAFCPLKAYCKALVLDHVELKKQPDINVDGIDIREQRRSLFKKQELKKASYHFKKAIQRLPQGASASVADMFDETLDATKMSMVEIGAALLSMQFSSYDRMIIGTAINSAEPGRQINVHLRKSNAI